MTLERAPATLGLLPLPGRKSIGESHRFAIELPNWWHRPFRDMARVDD